MAYSKEEKAIKNKEYHEKNREKNLVKMKEYHEKNREKILTSMKDYNANNYEKIRNRSLKYQYGITSDNYNKMFIDQNGCCAICNAHQSEFKKPLSVDHCHTTGKVRGLLCNECNLGLGKFKDNIELLEKAIEYLITK